MVNITFFHCWWSYYRLRISWSTTDTSRIYCIIF